MMGPAALLKVFDRELAQHDRVHIEAESHRNLHRLGRWGGRCAGAACGKLKTQLPLPSAVCSSRTTTSSALISRTRNL